MPKQTSSPWKTASIISFVSIFVFASGLWRPVLAAFSYRPVNRPLLAHGPVTHTTYADFTGCVDTVNTTAHITDIDASDGTGGTLTLPAAFSDDFNSPSLNSTFWNSGKWSPLGDPYTPTISGGVLTINGGDGAYVRSTTTYRFTHGVVEFTAEFGLGADQHIGFGDLNFTSTKLFLFSTRGLGGVYDGHLHARADNGSVVGSEDNIDLGPIPSGMHRYRIEWTAFDAVDDEIKFYIDGVHQSAADVLWSNSNLINLHAYISNNGSAALNVDSIQATPNYQTSGVFVSCIMDAGADLWDNISWVENVPANTSLEVQVATSDDGINFAPFAAVTNGTSFGGQLHQYIKYKIILTGDSGNLTVSPRVDSVTLNDVAPTSTPTPTNTATATATPTSTVPAPAINFPASGNTPPSTRPLFDWANVPGATSYTFQISTNPTFTALVVNKIVSVSAYTLPTDLPRNTLLYWRVRANVNGRLGAWSRTRHFFSANPPSVPALVSPAQGALVTSSTPTLDWRDSNPAAAYYEVQLSTDAAFTALLGRGQGGTTNQSAYTVQTALASGGPYYWRVRAVSTNGSTTQFSQWSAVRSFRVP